MPLSHVLLFKSGDSRLSHTHTHNFQRVCPSPSSSLAPHLALIYTLSSRSLWTSRDRLCQFSVFSYYTRIPRTPDNQTHAMPTGAISGATPTAHSPRRYQMVRIQTWRRFSRHRRDGRSRTHDPHAHSSARLSPGEGVISHITPSSFGPCPPVCPTDTHDFRTPNPRLVLLARLLQ